MLKEIERIIEETGGVRYGYFKADSPFFGLECGIALVVPLSVPVVMGITDAPTKTYFHHYRTTNAFIDSLCERLVVKMIGIGYNAAAVPASQSVDEYSGVFPHKTAAVKAGLGYIGKSALFISNDYGPRV
ncbi:MAG: epoxyqueuosine reductase, partial [Clostridia bacterium]|nr:epoxyqueuosine reductase [Clostridia bacterium]